MFLNRQAAHFQTESKIIAETPESRSELKSQSKKTNQSLDIFRKKMTTLKEQVKDLIGEINSLEDKQEQATALTELHTQLAHDLMAVSQTIPRVAAVASTTVTDSQNKTRLVEDFSCKQEIVDLLGRDKLYDPVDVVLQRLQECKNGLIKQKIAKGVDHPPAFRSQLRDDELKAESGQVCEWLNDSACLNNIKLLKYILRNFKLDEESIIDGIRNSISPETAQVLVDALKLIGMNRDNVQRDFYALLIDRGWVKLLDAYVNGSNLVGLHHLVGSVWDAAANVKLETVRHVLSNKLYFSHFDDDPGIFLKMLFNKACTSGNLDLVKYLANNILPPPIQALSCALRANQREIAQYLIDELNVGVYDVRLFGKNNTALAWFYRHKEPCTARLTRRLWGSET